MADWLFESAPSAPFSFAGYNVLDAVGMRFGQVDGWLRAPDGEVVMFALTMRTFMRTQRALVPLGYITQLDLGRRNVHLREITKRSIDGYGVRFDGGTLPDTDVIVETLRQSPYVRPEIRALLADPRDVQAMQPTRAWTLGDGVVGVPTSPPLSDTAAANDAPPPEPSARGPVGARPIAPEHVTAEHVTSAPGAPLLPAWTPLLPGRTDAPAWRSLASTLYAPPEPPEWR